MSSTNSPLIPGGSGSILSRDRRYDVPASVALRGMDFSQMNRAQREALLRRILEKTIHGLSFSPYLDGQAPGTEISEEQIRSRMAIIAPYVRWIRNFSCVEGNQEVPRIAREFGLKTMVGIELGPDHEENEQQIRNGIAVGQAGHADILAVGNEVMLREDLSEDALIEYIERVRAAVPGVPVATVDAYFLFEKHPRVAHACDVLLVNCYPFWEKCAANYSLLYIKEMYRRAKKVAGDRKVIISETGWPTEGTPYGAAVPGYDQALEYFINVAQWTEEEDIEMFYFSSFDENWKVGAEGDVGAYWGLWDAAGQLKYR